MIVLNNNNETEKSYKNGLEVKLITAPYRTPFSAWILGWRRQLVVAVNMVELGGRGVVVLGRDKQVQLEKKVTWGERLRGGIFAIFRQIWRHKMISKCQKFWNFFTISVRQHLHDGGRFRFKVVVLPNASLRTTAIPEEFLDFEDSGSDKRGEKIEIFKGQKFIRYHF